MLKIQLIGLWEFLCICFSLVGLKVLSLSLILVIFITVCLGVDLFGFILFGTLSASWIWMSVSFPSLGKFAAIIFSSMFSAFFPPLSILLLGALKCKCWYP